MKIADLKEEKIVRRPYTDISGKRKFEEKKFLVPYSTEIENQSYRILSKLIDVALVLSVGFFLEQNNIISLSSLTYLVPIGFLLLNSILESFIGSSLGKLMLNIAIVNENGKYLTIGKSLFRNTVSSILILLSFLLHNSAGFWTYYDDKLNKNGIYVISRNKISEIRKMLKTF